MSRFGQIFLGLSLAVLLALGAKLKSSSTAIGSWSGDISPWVVITLGAEGSLRTPLFALHDYFGN